MVARRAKARNGTPGSGDGDTPPLDQWRRKLVADRGIGDCWIAGGAAVKCPVAVVIGRVVRRAIKRWVMRVVGRAINE